jgi:pyrroloquinoline quinone biosynthesis protein B
MHVRVLGAAAGGGFPQWNCACGNCKLVRAGDPRVQARTQDSIAFSAASANAPSGDVGWNLVNASPDIRAQIEASPWLQPRSPRHTPIRSILLTNGDLDHVLGLFSLRESTPLEVWATDAVRAGLEERNALMRTLHRFPEQLTWKRLELGRELPLGDGTTVEARAVAGKAPTHLMGLVPGSAEDNVALWIRHESRLVVYAAACASLEGLEDAFAEADVLLLDGTFWSSDELVAAGLSRARAEDMAHLPIGSAKAGGEKGSLARLANCGARRKIYTHVNNSNPILVDGSPEHAAVRAAGWEVATDGMEIVP